MGCKSSKAIHTKERQHQARNRQQHHDGEEDHDEINFRQNYHSRQRQRQGQGQGSPYPNDHQRDDDNDNLALSSSPSYAQQQHDGHHYHGGTDPIGATRRARNPSTFSQVVATPRSTRSNSQFDGEYDRRRGPSSTYPVHAGSDVGEVKNGAVGSSGSSPPPSIRPNNSEPYHLDDDDGADNGDELVLICVDCGVEILDEENDVPVTCPKTGKRHR